MAKFTAENYNKITIGEMIKYIEENCPEDKSWFKSVAFTKEGKYNHLKAKKEFCKRYNPDLIPVAKEKEEPLSKKIWEEW